MTTGGLDISELVPAFVLPPVQFDVTTRRPAVGSNWNSAGVGHLLKFFIAFGFLCQKLQTGRGRRKGRWWAEVNGSLKKQKHSTTVDAD